MAQQAFVIKSFPFLSWMQRVLTSRIGEYIYLLTEVEEHHADPHPKRRLRIDAWRELLEGNHHGLNAATPLWLHEVLYKMKKDEVAKPGKYPRMIGDLGVAASLQGFRLTYLLKKAMAQAPFAFQNGVFEFVATPEPTKLESIFAKLMNPPGKYYFVFFSDDANLSVRVGADVYVYNVDIKWCDASHGPFIFDALMRITPTHMQEDMATLVAQCKLPIIVRDVTCKQRAVKLRPLDPRLYSGSTITTFINNLANILIFTSIVSSQAVTPLNIINSAITAGYGISLDQCLYPEDIQFLKHSPVLDMDGKWRAMLNLGVLCRSIGICKGDLPGRGPVSERAAEFVRLFIIGMYPRCHFHMRDLLLQQFTPNQKYTKMMLDKLHTDYNTYEDDSRAVFHADPTSIARRYRIGTDTLEFLSILIGTAGHRHVAADGFSAILAKDYGLGCQYVVDYD